MCTLSYPMPYAVCVRQYALFVVVVSPEQKGDNPCKKTLYYVKTLVAKRLYENGQMVKHQCLNILLLGPASGCMAVNT